MCLRLFLLCALLPAVSHFSFAAEPVATGGGTTPVQALSDTEQLESLEARIKELGDQETGLRQKWVVGQRTAMQKKRELLENDEEVRELQRRLNEQLEVVRSLQAEMEKLLDSRMARTTPDGAGGEVSTSQDSLQRDVLEYAKKRRELIQERDLLKRRMQSREKDAPSGNSVQVGAE